MDYKKPSTLADSNEAVNDIAGIARNAQAGEWILTVHARARTLNLAIMAM
jgi:hypothetical protein